MHHEKLDGGVKSLRVASVLAVVCACTSDISTRRDLPARASLGEEFYGVLCDRLGAQSLREDLAGSSYHLICHRKDGAFANKVDTRFLPAVQGAISRDGQVVSAEKQRQDRAHAIARVEALARRRSDVIAALDAMLLADNLVPAKDLKNADPTQSCAPAADERFRAQLSDLLDRLHADNLYNDGTLPNSTQSLGRLFTAFNADADLQSALARMEARKGYRPPEVALGVVQPLLAYPSLRDLNNSALRLLSPDSKPYDPNPRLDSSGRRVPEAGAAYAELTKLIEIGHHELRTATADPPSVPLVITHDSMLDRDVLNRSRSTAETLQQLLLVEDPLLGGGDPHYIVRRDQRGVASVALDNGAVPAPFVQDPDGQAKIDDLGQFVTNNGSRAPTPFPAPEEQTGTSRDGFGRATRNGGRLVYNYVDTSHTFIAALLEDLKPLVSPDPSPLMDAIAGLQPLLGSRKPTSKVYPGDAREGPATVNYNQFDPMDSAVLDLAYAAGQVLGDPATDDLLTLTRKLFAEHPNDMARLVGALLEAKKRADRHDEAKLSPRSTFWDELIDLAVKIARAPAVPGHPPLLEDLLTALAADDALPFKDVLANQMSFKDLVSYNRALGEINATPLSYQPGSSGGVDLKTAQTFEIWHIPVDRTQPDTGTNRSFFQRYLQLIHDTNGVTACNAENGRLFLHGVCDPGLGCIDLDFPTSPAPPAQECELYKIKNLAKFYLDSIVGEAQILFRSRLGVRTFQTPEMFTASSGLSGLWPTVRAQPLRPKPEFLNRLVFFDFSDSPRQGDTNYVTSCFISALNGPFVAPPESVAHTCVQQPPPLVPPPDFKGSTATTRCMERTIDDPFLHMSPPFNCPGDFCPEDAEPPDYQIHGLGNCGNGQWLAQRDNNILFAFEQPLTFPDGTRSSTYRALTPVASAFVSHGQQELFLSLIEVLYRHWQSADPRVPLDECDPSTTPADLHYCSRDGLVLSEPMLAEIFGQTDVMPALNNLNKILINTTIQHCDAVDLVTQRCMSSTTMNGITVMANAARALIDPNRNRDLTDRRGNRATTWNNGTTVVPQVTPLYLLTNALRSVDNAFDADRAAHAEAPDRKQQWLRARSAIVDQFFGVAGSGRGAVFSRPGLPRVSITAVDSIRSQLLARCPGTFAPPYTAHCGWARDVEGDTIFSNLKDTLSGPLFSAVQDLTEKLRTAQPSQPTDPVARVETEKLLNYLLSLPVNDTRRAGLLASLADVVQIASDQANFIPLLHALAPAVSLSRADSSGNSQIGLIDAQLTLLTRASGKAFNANNVELCANEVDPNQVVTAVLKQATIPVSINGKVQTPLEIYLDVIAEVNRAEPEQTGKFKPRDYQSIFEQVGDFMLSSEHGLEQFYEIVRQGTVK